MKIDWSKLPFPTWNQNPQLRGPESRAKLSKTQKLTHRKKRLAKAAPALEAKRQRGIRNGRRGPLCREVIFDAMAPGQWLTSPEVRELTGLKSGTVKGTLAAMRAFGMLKRMENPEFERGTLQQFRTGAGACRWLWRRVEREDWTAYAIEVDSAGRARQRASGYDEGRG